MRVKLRLSKIVVSLMAEGGVQQTTAAAKSGLSQADISRIVNGRVRGYSVWRLARTVSSLGASAKLILALPSGKTEEMNL
jgi:hypothetical protein